MRAALAIALLLALPVGLAATPGVFLAAEVSPGELRIALESSEAVNATLVVVREDPILGAVLERAVPVALGARTNATLDLGELRSGGNLTVKLVSSGIELPLALNSSIVVDAQKLLALPDLANLTTGAIPPLEGGRTHRFRSYPVHEGNYACACFLATSPEGTVVVGWLGVTQDGMAASLATVATSFDGGRSFSPPLVLNTNASAGATGFVGAGHGGRLSFLFDQSRPTSPGVAEWASTRVVVLDARNGSFVAATDVPRDAVATPAVNLRGLAVRPDGALLYATTGGIAVDGEARSAVHITQMLPDGESRRLADLALPRGSNFAAYQHIVANAAGQLAAVYVSYGGGPAFIQRSFDGGATWTSAQQVAELDAQGLDRRVMSVALDPAGTLHMATIVGRETRWTNTSEGSSSQEDTSLSYVRVPLVGPPSVVEVAGSSTPSALVPVGDAIDTPHLEVHGARVWLLWQPREHVGERASQGLGATGIESTDGGLTFGEPYTLEGENGESIHMLLDLALMPDGRPMLLAWVPRPGSFPVISVVPLFDPLAPALVPMVATPATAGPAPTPAPTLTPAFTLTPTLTPTPTPTLTPEVAPVRSPTAATPLPRAPTDANVTFAEHREDASPGGEVVIPAAPVGALLALAAAVALAGRRRA